ncbi:MAG: Rpn family recombination-promoting nuclease/putative transposase [Clostridia bacterium]|nr:Rpn family recombination-promoting nuclease/putative transposase [Clostridia bacterium]
MVNKIIEKPLNLKDDIIFKVFFSRKGNEEFLIDFLKALLKIDIKEIKIQEEVNLEKLSKKEKGGRLDLQAKLDNGIIVNIEMQIKNNHDIEERTTYYSSKVISRETKRGIKYKDIKQVIMINILDYEMLGFDEYISETAVVLDKHREYEVLKGIKWYFIELPKFRKQNPDMNEKINQWLAFIDDYDRRLVEMAEEKNETLKKARLQISYLTGDEEAKRMQWLEEKWEMDRASEIWYERNEARKEVAKEMKKKGIAIETICEVTKLTKEEIEKIEN